MTPPWRSLTYSTPDLYRGFRLRRRLRKRVWRVTVPIWRPITLEEIALFDEWRAP